MPRKVNGGFNRARSFVRRKRPARGPSGPANDSAPPPRHKKEAARNNGPARRAASRREPLFRIDAARVEGQVAEIALGHGLQGGVGQRITAPGIAASVGLPLPEAPQQGGERVVPAQPAQIQMPKHAYRYEGILPLIHSHLSAYPYRYSIWKN